MMIKKLSLIVFFFLAVFSLSIGQSLLNYVPNDATFVLSLNPQNLNSKVNLRQLKEYDFYNMALAEMAKEMGEGSDMFMNVMADAESYGMDLMAPSHIFGKIGDGGGMFGLLFKLSDESKFSEFLRGLMNEEYAKLYSQHAGYHLLKVESDAWLAWSGNMAFVGGGEMEIDVNWEEDGAADTYDSAKASAMEEWVSATMSRSADQSIRTNSRFNLATTKPTDAHLWIDYAFLGEEFNKGFYKELSKELGGFDPSVVANILKSFYEDTYWSLGLNFGKGKISFKSQTFSNPPIMDLWKRTLDHKFNKKLAKYIRGENLFGYFSMSMSTKNAVEAYKELIHKAVGQMPGYGPMVSSALDILGIFIDEDALPNLFKGDMILAFTGMQKVQMTITDYEYDEDFNATEIQKTVEKDIPEVSLIWTHRSKEDWMKFVNLGLKSSFLQSVGNYYKLAIPGMDMDAYVALKDGMLFISNSTDLVQKRLEKGYSRKERLDKKHCQMMAENAMVLYWDIPNTLDLIGSGGGGMDMAEFIKIGKENFESVLVTSSRTVGNSLDGEMSLNFVKKDVNSLKQIFELINEFFLNMMGGSNS